MKSYLRDNRGVGMILEIVLAAAVLSLVGLAFYQSKHSSTTAKAASVTQPQAAATAADDATAAVTSDATSDDSLGATDESSADEAASLDTDADNLGGSFDENSF